MRAAAAGFALCLAAAALAAQEGPAKWFEDFSKRFPPAAKNAAAEDLQTLSLALGFDSRGAGGDQHPTAEDLDANRQLGFGSWLDAQIKTSDDLIGKPPPLVVEFLQKRESSLWHVVGLLEREVPEWGFDPDAQYDYQQHPELLFVAQLNRFLLAAALIEERAERHDQAADLLEASWSLYRSIASRPELIYQLIAASVAKAQAGALRKMSEPRFDWVDRMSGDDPRKSMMEAWQSDKPLAVHRGAMALDNRDSFWLSGYDSLWLRGYTAVASDMQDLSVCEISRLSSEQIWKPATEEFQRWKEKSGESGSQATILEMSFPSLTEAFRRVSRLLVDRELTAKILGLRQEKAVARPKRWPEKLFDTESRVCPGTEYEYQTRGAGMSIRFKGSVAEPGAPALVLPLSFEAMAPRPTPSPTPTRRPSPTPTPRPSLTPSRARA